MKTAPHTRILAIDPTTKGFAWCLLEGTRTLVDWGTVQVPPPRNENCLKKVATLLDVFRPDMVSVEDCAFEGARRSGRAPELILAIEELARSRRVPASRMTRRSVDDLFAPTRGKFGIATAIADIFPELKPRLPRKRKPWMSEDERMNIFDAVGLALSCRSSIEAQEADAALPTIKF